MKFILYILCIYYLFILNVAESVKSIVIKNFPVYENEEFYLQIKSQSEILQLYTIIILNCYKNDKLVENAVLNPGFLKGLPKKIYGNFFSVLRYNIKPRLVEVTLAFNRISNDANLRVIYMETDSKSLRDAILTNAPMQKEFEIANLRISLRLHWTLTFIQKTLDHREGGFLAGSVGLLVCHASDGSPFSLAKILGVQTLKEKSTLSFKSTDKLNEEQFAFIPTINDHMKKVHCKAGSDAVESTIKIFHHPTAVSISPTVGKYLRNDTTLLCQPSNGYPTATAKWKFVKGPNNAQLYYNVKGSGTILHIKKNAPIGSRWTFQCNASNHIPNSLNGGVTESIQFIVGVQPPPTVLIIALVSSGLILLIIVTIAVLCKRHRKCGSVKKVSAMAPSYEQALLYTLSSHDKKSLNLSSQPSISTDKNSQKGSINSSLKQSLSKESNHDYPIDYV